MDNFEFVVGRGEEGGESCRAERVTGNRRVAALSRSDPGGDDWRLFIKLFDNSLTDSEFRDRWNDSQRDLRRSDFHGERLFVILFC
jgi:hypothetical protein